jgi:precorrin-6Y C5,15-methyltransferase (decarboxylating)
MEITILGIGMGSPATLTGEAKEALLRADCVVGARRILDSLPPEVSPPAPGRRLPRRHRLPPGRRPELRAPVGGHERRHRILQRLRRLLPLLEGRSVRVLCGVTTAQYLAAKLRRPCRT